MYVWTNKLLLGCVNVAIHMYGYFSTVFLQSYSFFLPFPFLSPLPLSSVPPSPLSPFLPLSPLPLLQVQTYLKETWVPRLRESIRSSLAQVTKGWFNLEETSHEVYAGSKLKKMMELVKFAMQVRMQTNITCMYMYVMYRSTCMCTLLMIYMYMYVFF